jgi:hypothetical protein
VHAGNVTGANVDRVGERYGASFGDVIASAAAPSYKRTRNGE